MPGSMVFLAAAIVAATFGWAAASKLVGFGRWRRALTGYGLTRPLERFAGVATPFAEAGVALLVLVGPLPVAGALALVMLAGFCVLILRARVLQGDRLPCGCFGGTSERDYRLMLLRNTLIAVPAGIVVAAGEPGLVELASSIDAPEVLPAGLVVVAAGLVVWMVKGVSESLSTKGRRT